MSEFKTCTRCVMDTTDSQITFDEQGVCDHCRTFDSDIKPNWDTGQKGWNDLQLIVDRVKKEGKRKDFDCIMGMSGGIDSSYLLYLAVEKLGLRPLVFHVDAGWNSQTAVNNIEVMIEKLNLDLFTEVIDWEEMKDLQRAFFRSCVPHIDTPQDHAFFATMYKFADKYKVNNIMTGANYSTECIRNPKEWMYFQSDSRQIRDIFNQFGESKLNNYPLTNILWHKVYLPYVKNIKVITPLNYMPYIKTEAVELLKDKFGWQEYPQKHFESRFTKFYESYWLYEKFGFDVRKVQYSSLILTGQMTREEAIEKLKSKPYDPENIHHDFEFVANKLDMEVSELQACFDAPNKTYKDYKNQESIYNMGATIMRSLGLVRGGKR
ncbi:N-acetyl sugar amidotransferase [uncultured Roseivirga sp.]|uniref:N-acetyl sugar amidotransferase n=1 Tax=uncultured Roseivirga sp. TaxID=543088 RepID=UPI0030D6DCF6